MAIRLHGISSSRAFRSVWAAEELGIDFEHVPTTFGADSKEDGYLAVNPNGRVPALNDDGFNLFESMAINLYLAKNHGPAGFYPADPKDEAHTWQWSVWGISEIEPLQMEIVIQKFFLPEDKRDAKVVTRAENGLARPLNVLNVHLADNAYLLGDVLSIADINLAGVMELLNMIAFDTSAWPNVERWLEVCRGLDSYARAKARD
jgi:glutathione S-transferase|tara:strand:- start:95 stop:706 length:612 start_codon:yes stop_codon:yes gene_type:complete